MPLHIRSINFSICGKFPISDKWPTDLFANIEICKSISTTDLFTLAITALIHPPVPPDLQQAFVQPCLIYIFIILFFLPTTRLRTALSYLHIYYSFLFTDNNNFSRINSWCMPYIIIFRENYKGIWISSSAMAFMRVLVIQMYFC